MSRLNDKDYDHFIQYLQGWFGYYCHTAFASEDRVADDYYGRRGGYVWLVEAYNSDDHMDRVVRELDEAMEEYRREHG